MFSLISAIGRNREIGKNKQLIFHVKDDMKFFRDTTKDHKVVMGRATWESLPDKLKDRKNIVITRSDPKSLEKPSQAPAVTQISSDTHPSVTQISSDTHPAVKQNPSDTHPVDTQTSPDTHSTSKVSSAIAPDEVVSNLDSFIKTNQDSEEEIFIIGGGTIYSAFLPYAKHLYLTEIDASAEDADTFFPQFDKSKYRRTIIKKGSDHGINYSIVKYTKL